MTSIEQEIQNSGARIEAEAVRMQQTPTATQETIDRALSISGYLTDLAARIQEVLDATDPVDPIDPVDPVDPPVGRIPIRDTQLHGKPLPAFPEMYLSSPRGTRYGITLTNSSMDFQGEHIKGVQSCGILMQGDVTAKNFIVTASGGDGLKINGGYDTAHVVIRNGQVGGLGLDPGAHADGLQGRGNIASLDMYDMYFYMPVSGVPGSLSNACLIMDCSQGTNGIIRVYDSIFYGGNRAVMLDQKGTNLDVGTYYFYNTAFIIDEHTPQYTLLQPGFENKFTFDASCGVYYRDSHGICHLVERDVKNFRLDTWRTSEQAAALRAL